MKRFDGTNPDIDKFGTGKNGFQDKDASMGVGGSKPDEAWLDAVQEEISRCIENNGDALDAANFQQLYENGTRPGIGHYGDGKDGPLVVNGADVTLSADAYHTTVKIETPHRVITNGFRFFANVSIIVDPAIAGGIVPADDLDASGATGGTGAALGTLISSQAGANGGAGVPGTNGNNQTEAEGAAGGDGGSGGAGAGGTGGTVSAIAANSGRIGDLITARNMVAVGSAGDVFAKGGASGASGAGDGANSGGGGGAAAPVGVVASPYIDLGVNGFIRWDGGDGGNGSAGDSGGGGGGGGGYLGLIGRVQEQPAQITAVGGTRGAGVGTGNDGADGSDGTVAFLYA